MQKNKRHLKLKHTFQRHTVHNQQSLPNQMTFFQCITTSIIYQVGSKQIRSVMVYLCEAKVREGGGVLKNTCCIWIQTLQQEACWKGVNWRNGKSNHIWIQTCKHETNQLSVGRCNWALIFGQSPVTEAYFPKAHFVQTVVPAQFIPHIFVRYIASVILIDELRNQDVSCSIIYWSSPHR